MCLHGVQWCFIINNSKWCSSKKTIAIDPRDWQAIKRTGTNDAVYLARPRRVWLTGWSGPVGPTRSPLSNGRAQGSAGVGALMGGGSDPAGVKESPSRHPPVAGPGVYIVQRRPGPLDQHNRSRRKPGKHRNPNIGFERESVC